jgi:hypothetical protein
LETVVGLGLETLYVKKVAVFDAFAVEPVLVEHWGAMVEELEILLSD